jgi:hypothetical protein
MMVSTRTPCVRAVTSPADRVVSVSRAVSTGMQCARVDTLRLFGRVLAFDGRGAGLSLSQRVPRAAIGLPCTAAPR